MANGSPGAPPIRHGSDLADRGSEGLASPPLALRALAARGNRILFAHGCDRRWSEDSRLVVASRPVVLEMSSGRSAKIDLFQSFRSILPLPVVLVRSHKLLPPSGRSRVFSSLSGVLIY